MTGWQKYYQIEVSAMKGNKNKLKEREKEEKEKGYVREVIFK